MATKGSVFDKYSNRAVFVVSESAANTMTWEKLETGLSVYDKIGWVIQRIELAPYPTMWAQFNASSDYVLLALAMSNGIAANQLSAENPSVYALATITRQDLGAAASGQFIVTPIVFDYTGLAGGGILILPNPLYFGVVGNSLAALVTCVCTIYYTAIEMSDADYFNLIQSRQLLISS